MSSVELKARELLADQYENAGMYETSDGLRSGLEPDVHGNLALRAIAAALREQPEARGVVDALRARLEGLSAQYDPLSGVGAGIDRAIRELDALTAAQQPAPPSAPVGVDVSGDDLGPFDSDTAALAFLRMAGNGNPNVNHAVERLRLSLTQQPAQAAPGDDGERCESDASECGPVEFHDSEGVPLCKVCWEGLLSDSAPADDAAGVNRLWQWGKEP